MKVLWLSDTPQMHSGYGVQTRIVLQGLRTKGHDVVCLGGALNHQQYSPYIWQGIRIYPVHGYGNASDVRQVLDREKPDVFVVAPDARFLSHVWHLENEIRQRCPLVFWHIWDNDPFPRYNIPFYDSCSLVVSASRFTQALLKSAGRDSPLIPLAVDSSQYRPLSPERVEMLKRSYGDPKTFWVVAVNRNSHRKRVVDIPAIFCRFARKVDIPVGLLLHTDPRDREGPSLDYAIQSVCLPDNAQIRVSVPCGQPSSYVNSLYNVGDVHLSISVNEGVGVTVGESMAAGRPNIAAQTGGMAELLLHEEDDLYCWSRIKRSRRGWSVAPAIRSITGTNGATPYLMQDWVADEDVVAALIDAACNLTTEARAAMGAAAREYIVKHHSPHDVVDLWDACLSDVVSSHTPPPRYFVVEPSRIEEDAVRV